MYWSKKEVLEALGKNEKDVRYLDRAIARGEVVHEGGGYYIMREYVEELQCKVMKLEKEKTEGESSVVDSGEVEGLKKKVWMLEETVLGLESDKKELERKVYDLTMGGNTSSELKEAKAQWDYYQGLYEKEKADKDFRIRKAFDWIKSHVKGVSWDEFNEWVMGDED